METHEKNKLLLLKPISLFKQGKLNLLNKKYWNLNACKPEISWQKRKKNYRMLFLNKQEEMTTLL